MIELAQHIEVLLLENDCVIIPGLGGFVAHYTPTTSVAKENIFLPPTRIIGFNPQLKMNDGLLAQSYMAVYGTNFSDATKVLEKEVQKLLGALHDNGKVELPNVGQLNYSIHDSCTFAPYDNKIATPYLYGLDSFEMQELSALKKVPVDKDVLPYSTINKEKKQEFTIPYKHFFRVNIAAMIAVITLFFLLSTPIENTEVVKCNYAQLLPDELFNKIEKQSLAINSVVVRQSIKPTASTKKKVITPVAVREVRVSQPSAATTTLPETTNKPNSTEVPKAKAAPVGTPSKTYHVIVASLGSEKDAQFLAKELVKKGFSGAKAIIGDGKIRVSIQASATESEAYQALNNLRQNEAYQNAWVLKK